MATKLARKTYPPNHKAEDFQCFGPPATKDGDFSSCKIADLGCFTQDGKDTNKYYHAAVVKSKKNDSWYVYFEWGRTGKDNPDFLFMECESEAEAQKEFAKQLMSKNAGRGVWVSIAGMQTLQAKPGKDCYLVRPQATRSTGLPDARTIQCADGLKEEKAKKPKPKTGPTKKYHPQTVALIRDLTQGTVSYARGSMATGSIPTQNAIDEARTILDEAGKIVSQIGGDAKTQVHSRELKKLTYLLYGRIPKVKPLKAHESTWILSNENIISWRLDLDAFESALYGAEIQTSDESALFADYDVEMEFLEPSSDLRKWVTQWATKATANRHPGLGTLKVHNLWKLHRPRTYSTFKASIEKIAKQTPRTTEKPHNQSRPRPDMKLPGYRDANGALLFHGSRSVNISGLLKSDFRDRNTLNGVVLVGTMLGCGKGGGYLADDWKKSAGYCSIKNSYWAAGGGSVKGRKAFMLLVSCALGNIHVAPKPHGYTSPPKGHHSVMGKGGVTDCYGSKLKNNEYVLYDNSQHHFDYLMEFEG